MMPTAPKHVGYKDRPKQKAWRTTTATNNKRGYGHDWRKLRNAYIAEHPFCEMCDERGVVRDADEVHHVRAFNGVDDPLRLDWSNLQAVCRRCHQIATGGRRRGVRVLQR